MLTPRERLRRCYSHEELDRPGVYCRTAFPGDDPSYDPLRDLLEWKTERKARWPGLSILEPLPISSHTKPHSEEFDLRIDTLHTPKGDLVRQHLVGRRHQPGMTIKAFAATPQDTEAYLSLPMPKIGGEVDSFFEQDRQIGDGGIVDIFLRLNPAGEASELLGSETFAMMTMTDREWLHALCERHLKILLDVVDYLVDRGVGPYFSLVGEEYVAPPLHGHGDFFEFNVRYDKPIIDRIHDAGGRVHVHCHGSIRTVFDGFLEMGADVLHPFEAPPMGDITPAEAKHLANGRLCLEGNIQIADMYEQTPQQVAELTRNLIEKCFADRRGLIICPTASPYIHGAGAGCLEQFRAMVDTVVNWS